MSTVNVVGAADLMKVHPNTVEAMIRAGKIPAAKIGRAYVMLESDVLAYIEAQIVAQTAERLARLPDRPAPAANISVFDLPPPPPRRRRRRG